MSSNARLEVLVVDDDRDVRLGLRGMLEDGGHAVEEAANGDEALRMLAERVMDAVLLDLDMPGMNGLDALLKIREVAPDMGVIVVTGKSTTENAFRAAKRGAFDFITKPFTFLFLLSAHNDPSSATAATRRGDWNSSAMPPFAAAHC